MCNAHFSHFCYSPSQKRLKRDSLPTLHLLGKILLEAKVFLLTTVYILGFLEESTEINSLYRFFKETNVLKRKRDISDDGNRNNKIVSLRDIGMHINIFKFIRKIFDFGCVHNIAGNIYSSRGFFHKCSKYIKRYIIEYSLGYIK